MFLSQGALNLAMGKTVSSKDAFESVRDNPLQFSKGIFAFWNIPC
jgi:hypothetical protein